MTTGQGNGREHGLARQIVKLLTKRGLVVAAVLVGAGVATVLAASATTHSSPAREAVERTASPQPSRLGGRMKNATALRHRTAVRGHLPKAVKRSHPRALHLQAAH